MAVMVAEKEFQILDCKVTIATNAEVELVDRLEDLRVTARQELPCSRILPYFIRQEGSKFLIQEDLLEIGSAAGRQELILHLHELITRKVLSDYPEHLWIHAGCATLEGKRLLLVGPKGAGKTTLLCKLIFDGAEVHSDEYVLANMEEVLPFPRKFHLKEGTLGLIPGLRRFAGEWTPYPAFGGGIFYFWDPTCLGYDWKIISGGIDAIFFLEANPLRDTRIEPLPKWQMIQKLMFEIHNLGACDPRSQFSKLCSIVNGSKCYALYAGGLEKAAEIVRTELQ